MKSPRPNCIRNYPNNFDLAIMEFPDYRTDAVAANPAGSGANRVATSSLARRAALLPGLICSFLLCSCTDQNGPDNQQGDVPADRPSLTETGEPGPNPASSPQPSAAITAPEQTASPPASRATRSAPPPAYDAHEVLDELSGQSWDGEAASDGQATLLLQRLRSLGADALIPIRDFLLDAGNSGAVPPALRQALLDVLLSLGLPEVEDVALQLLASAPAASEVLQLGQYLEAVQPGKYSEVVLAAAEQALIDADSATALPADFFLLLGALGTEETALLLSELQAQYGAYASLALALIPDGGGLLSLAQDARLFEAGQDTLQGRLAVQLLAQLAPQFPQAASVLLELAEKGAIPHDVWPYVLDIVAGSWELTLIQPQPGDLIGSHTFYRPEGNQVIYRAARPYGESGDSFQSQRLFLLDRLQPLAPPDLARDTDP